MAGSGLSFRVATVVHVADVAPTMRRVVFEGDFAAFFVPAGTLGAFVKLLIPTAESVGRWPSVGENGRLVWPDGPRPAIRTYSVRAFDPGRQRLTVDFVLHGPHGAGSRWAISAEPGQGLGVYGPGCPAIAAARRYLLAGDDTAVPAVASMLESMRAGADVRVVMRVADTALRQSFPSPAQVDFDWVEPSRPLLDPVRDADWTGDPDVLIWAGAEAADARAIRLYALKERALDRDRCQVLNYWKRGTSEGNFAFTE